MVPFTKTSKREKGELFKNQQEREKGVIQNPATKCSDSEGEILMMVAGVLSLRVVASSLSSSSLLPARKKCATMAVNAAWSWTMPKEMMNMTRVLSTHAASSSEQKKKERLHPVRACRRRGRVRE